MQFHHNTLTEMCARLRSAGRFDTQLSDRVSRLTKHLSEPASDKYFHPSKITRKPSVDNYSDSKDQLKAVLEYRFTTCPADVASCLTMAVLLYQWQTADASPPTIRLGSGGFVVAEWDGKGKDSGHVMIQHGEVFWGCCPKNILTKLN